MTPRAREAHLLRNFNSSLKIKESLNFFEFNLSINHMEKLRLYKILI